MTRPLVFDSSALIALFEANDLAYRIWTRADQGQRLLITPAGAILEASCQRILKLTPLGAVEVHASLADRGQHHAPSVPDIPLSAIAETSGMTVLHLDKDFELIAEVTGQPFERIRAT